MMFPAFSNDVEMMRKILQNFPPAIRAAFDLSLENFFTIYGFLAYLFTFVTLAGAIQAMNLGVGILSKEESGKTIDFLLSKPISRVKVMTNKILAAISLILVTNIIFDVVALAVGEAVSKVDFDEKIYILILLTMLLIQLFFLALGVLFSVIVPKIKSVISVSLPTVFTLFFIGTLGAILGNDNVKMFSPFKFFDSSYIIAHTSYDTKYLIIEAVFIVVAIVASFVIYVKKDIRAVS
jgi:ABC-2 type transport system permease protein